MHLQPRSHRETAAPPRGRQPSLHTLPGRGRVGAHPSRTQARVPAARGAQRPAPPTSEADGELRRLFFPHLSRFREEATGAAGSISGLLPSWAAALGFVRVPAHLL